MRKFQLLQDFSCSIEQLFQARETRYNRTDLWPEVKNVEVIERLENQEKLEIHREIFIDPGLPGFISSTLGTPQLKISEVLYYNRPQDEFKVEVNLLFSKSLLSFCETTVHFSISSQQVQRRISAELSSPLPLIGGKLEKLLEAEFISQSKKDYERLSKIIASFE